MEKNKKEVNLIKSILTVIVIGLIVIATVEHFGEFIEDYYAKNIEINYFVFPFAFLAGIFAAIVENFGIVGIYIAVLLASRSVDKTILDETDFEKNKSLYRDTIKEYSVSVLNYIDNFKLDYKQSYTAKLLELQKKGIIKIDNNKIKVTGEPTEEIDIIFVNSIKDNKVTMPLSEYESLIEKEALEKELITQAGFFSTVKNKKVTIITTLIFILMFAIVILFSFAQEGDLDGKIFIAVVLSILLVNSIIFFGIAFAIAYFIKASSSKRYKRTEKGKEINRQLDGLKLFMEKFSNLDNKESKHLALWDDYLIYSVMFDINQNIQKEYSKFLENN